MAYGCMAVWLYGCMAVWLYGCMAVWLYGCMAVWLSTQWEGSKPQPVKVRLGSKLILRSNTLAYCSKVRLQTKINFNIWLNFFKRRRIVVCWKV